MSPRKSQGHVVQGSVRACGHVPGRRLPMAEISIAGGSATALAVAGLRAYFLVKTSMPILGIKTLVFS